MPNETIEGRDYWEEPMTISPEGSNTPEGETEETTQAGEGEAAAEAETVAGEGEAATDEKKDETVAPDKDKAAETDEVTPPEIKAEDVLAHLSPTLTPEAELAQVKRDYAGSSKEALRLKGDNEAFAEIFASQNIEVVRDANGKPTGVAPSKDYGKGDSEAPTLDFNTLSNGDQALAENDPQAFIDTVLNKALSGQVRVTPTVEKAVKPLSPERVVEVETHLKGLVEADGTATHPDFEANLPIIRQYVTDPAKSQSFKDFVAQSPEMAYEFASMKVVAAKAFLQSAAQKAQEALLKKEQGSADTLHPGPAGGGSPALTGGADIAKIGSDIGDQIANASGF